MVLKQRHEAVTVCWCVLQRELYVLKIFTSVGSFSANKQRSLISNTTQPRSGGTFPRKLSSIWPAIQTETAGDVVNAEIC